MKLPKVRDSKYSSVFNDILEDDQGGTFQIRGKIILRSSKKWKISKYENGNDNNNNDGNKSLKIIFLKKFKSLIQAVGLCDFHTCLYVLAKPNYVG